MAQDRQLTAAHQSRSKPSSSVPAGCRQASPGTALDVALTQTAMLSQASMTPFGDVGPSHLNMCIFCR